MIDALELIFARNAFFRRLHFMVLGALVISILIIGFLIGLLAYILKNPTAPIYFATDELSRLIDVVPTSKQNMPTEAVMEWTIEGIQAALSYDYVNYRAQLQNAQKYFTNYGWSSYMKALTATGNLTALTTDKIVVQAQIISSPKIITQGLLSGKYAWKFEMNAIINYWYPPYEKPSYTNGMAISVIVQRQSILQSYKGLGIVQIIGTYVPQISQYGAQTTNAAPSPAQGQ